MEKRYIKGLDGLRAIAVILVIGYHLKLPGFKGGVLGVTVFFVLSGFLITRLLLQELRDRQHIDLKQFWMKRIRRIWPAMLLMVSIVIIVTALFNRVLFTKASKDFLSVVFGVNNWYQIFNNISYFDNAGAPSPLLHCWSLAIETQFYLIFPLIIVFIYHLNLEQKKKRDYLVKITLAGMLLSALLMFILYNPTGDPTRIYYGLDTRAFSLLAGALLAMIHFYYPRLKLSYHFSVILSIVSLLGIFIMSASFAGYESFFYRGGYFLASILTVFVIAGILKQEGVLTEVLSLPFFDWMGKLSYSIYLWHYPIIIILTGGKKMSVGMMILVVVLTFIFAGISYYFVETPIRYHLFLKVIQSVKDHTVFASKKKKRQFSMVVLVVSLFLVSVLSVQFVPKVSMSDKINVEAKVKKPKVKVSDQEILSKVDLLMIGDSIALGAQDALQTVFPQGVFDCKESRQCKEGLEILQKKVNEEKWQGNTIIFALGSNGPIHDELNQVKTLLNKKQNLFILTIHDPYVEWMDANNKKIKDMCKKYKNVHLIDWNTYCTGHDDWLYSDETHLRPEGANAYTSYIKQRIIEVYKDK